MRPLREVRARPVGRLRKLRAATLVVLGLLGTAIVTACSSTKEWEEKPGEIALYADPLPPVAGATLVLGVTAKNVGPVDVFQGTTRIASLVNVDLSKRYDVRVRAVSADLPRAVTVAYDRERIEATATAFPSAPAPTDPGPGPTDPLPAEEDCPGVEDLAANTCPPTPDAGTVSVRVINTTDGPLSVYASLPDPITAGSCVPSVVALVAAGAERPFSSAAGTVLRFVDDRTAQSVRIVRLPTVATCTLRVPKGS